MDYNYHLLKLKIQPAEILFWKKTDFVLCQRVPSNLLKKDSNERSTLRVKFENSRSLKIA